MILYATKQTIEELDIPMPDELSTFSRIMANKIIDEQTNDSLLEWGLKYFVFDGRKCVQAVNFASKLGIFLFDIKNDEIQWIANGIAIYLKDIYSKDIEMQKLLDKFFGEYPACAFSKLTNRSIIVSLNHNQSIYAYDGYRFYEYIKDNVLNSKRINKDFNWKNLTTVMVNGKKDYEYPAEIFRKLLVDRYKK